jgi:hypothetical protein
LPVDLRIYAASVGKGMVFDLQKKEKKFGSDAGTVLLLVGRKSTFQGSCFANTAIR